MRSILGPKGSNVTRSPLGAPCSPGPRAALGSGQGAHAFAPGHQVPQGKATTGSQQGLACSESLRPRRLRPRAPNRHGSQASPGQLGRVSSQSHQARGRDSAWPSPEGQPSLPGSARSGPGGQQGPGQPRQAL